MNLPVQCYLKYATPRSNKFHQLYADQYVPKAVLITLAEITHRWVLFSSFKKANPTSSTIAARCWGRNEWQNSSCSARARSIRSAHDRRAAIEPGSNINSTSRWKAFTEASRDAQAHYEWANIRERPQICHIGLGFWLHVLSLTSTCDS